MKKDAEIEDFSFDAVKSKMRTTMEVKPKATGQRIWAGAAIMRDESHLESVCSMIICTTLISSH
jgi:hypothetical protein